jgi:hypothetical protein
MYDEDAEEANGRDEGPVRGAQEYGGQEDGDPGGESWGSSGVHGDEHRGLAYEKGTGEGEPHARASGRPP